jgi:hypothetical protein
MASARRQIGTSARPAGATRRLCYMAATPAATSENQDNRPSGSMENLSLVTPDMSR